MTNTDTTPHNPNRVHHGPPPQQQPRTFKASRTPLGHRRAEAALRRVEPLAPVEDTDTDERRSIKSRAIAEALMLLMFRLVWGLNLAGTVAAAVLIGRKISTLLVSADLTPWEDQDYAIVAAAYQVFITHVQQYLWRTGETYTGTWQERRRAFWADLDKTKLSLVVFFGTTDALPTAWFIMAFSTIVWDNAPWVLPYALAAGIAIPMAMLVEPAMTKHRRAMKRLFASIGYNVKWM